MENFFTLICPDILAIIISLFTFYLIISDHGIEKKHKTLLLLTSSMILTTTILEIMTIYFDYMGGEQYILISNIANGLGFTLTPVIGIMFGIAIYGRLQKYKLILLSPALALMILCAFSSFSGWIFSISDTGKYSRGPLFFINPLIGIYAFVVFLYAANKQTKNYDKSEKIYLKMQYFIVLFGNIIQILFPNMLLIWPCVSVVFLLYYDFLKEYRLKYDTLTNTRNRKCFQERFDELNNTSNVTLGIFDLNNLKFINDTYGHSAGDEYLKNSVEVIKKVFSNLGSIYRIGGDEFGFICEDISRSQLDHCIRKFEKELKKIEENSKEQTKLGIAYGFATYDEENFESFKKCFEFADEEMYKKKSIQKLKEI